MSDLSRKVFIAETAAVREHLDEQAQAATAKAEAALAPLEAKARALREQQDAKLRANTLREAAGALWALANRTTEQGKGVLWAADYLRRRADEEQP